jgi:transposase
MKDLEEQRVCMKFCLKLAKTFAETFQMLKQAYGEDCLSRTKCYKWYQRFKSGRTSTEDEPKTGRPSTSKDNDHVEKVRAVIREKRHLTVREISEEVHARITKSSCHTILTEKLEMHHVAAKIVPHLLADEQKANRVTVRSSFIIQMLTTLKNFITGDEM